MDYDYLSIITLILLLLATFVFRHRPSTTLPPTISPTLPILGHLYLLRKPLHRTLASISSKHGPILLLRFGSRRVLLLSSPTAAEECFTKNDIVFANRPRLLAGKILGFNYTSFGWGDHWRNLRRISTIEILSSHRLNEFHDIRADEGRLLVHKLIIPSMSSNYYSPVNLSSMFHELTLNVMMRMISGKRYFGGDMEEEEGRRFQEIVKETFMVSGASNLGDYLPVFRWLGVDGLEKKMILLQKKRDFFVQGLIDQLRKLKKDDDNKKKKNTMIEVLLQLQEADPEYYTDQLIKSFVLVR